VHLPVGKTHSYNPKSKIQNPKSKIQMSVVAARKYPDKLVFAADSIRVSGFFLRETSRVTGNEQSKLFEVNDLIIGSVGLIMELSFMQIFARNHKPAAPTVEAVLDFIIEFYNWAKSKDDSFGKKNDYLIGIEREIFRVCDSYLVEKINEFSAIGAGEYFALTAMYLDKSPQEAVEISNELCVYCAGPTNAIIKNYGSSGLSMLKE
jgi:ATP-dependent protease HslVU (ClpYQ) peptidase subunit